MKVLNFGIGSHWHGLLLHDVNDDCAYLGKAIDIFQKNSLFS